jgi:hypothetical protein
VLSTSLMALPEDFFCKYLLGPHSMGYGAEEKRRNKSINRFQSRSNLALERKGVGVIRQGKVEPRYKRS